MTVHHLKTRLPREVTKCMLKMTAHANAGLLTTIAFIAVTPNGFIADVCGQDQVTPQMLIELQTKIIRRQRRG